MERTIPLANSARRKRENGEREGRELKGGARGV